MHSAFKAVILILLLVVIFELFQALYFMIRDRGRSSRTVQALTWRVGTWIALIVLLVIGIWAGWITPHGLA